MRRRQRNKWQRWAFEGARERRGAPGDPGRDCSERGRGDGACLQLKNKNDNVAQLIFFAVNCGVFFFSAVLRGPSMDFKIVFRW